MYCEVCNTSLRSSKCSNCLWPVGAVAAIADQALGEEVLKWAKLKYRATISHSNNNDARDGIELPLTNSKRGSEKFSAERSNVDFNSGILIPESAFQSRMKAQIGSEDTQSLDSLRSELVALSRKIASNEDQRLRSEAETSKLLQRSQEIEQGVQKVTKAVEDMNSFFDEQNQKNQELDNKWHSIQETSGKYENQIQDLIREQQQQISEINLLKSLLSSKYVGQATMASTAVLPNNEPMVIASNLSFAPEELDLLRDYNSNSQEVPNALRDRAYNVSIDDETFNRLRNGDESNIAFKPDRKGNYFVITRGGFRYLVPNKQRRIITQIYTVTKAIYKCDGYSEGYKGFCLIKPALVTEESSDCWKLSQQGVLEFN
jgi:hypothetical protein